LIHGFNVSFESAVRKLAQFSSDLNVDGPAILLTWASRGNLKKYREDQKNRKNNIYALCCNSCNNFRNIS